MSRIFWRGFAVWCVVALILVGGVSGAMLAGVSGRLIAPFVAGFGLFSLILELLVVAIWAWGQGR
jgi:hypothetical protein